LIVQSGAKAGLSTQELFLKEPDWVQFFVARNPDSKLTKEFSRHSRSLDLKPFVEKCFRCNREAKLMTAYAGNAESVMLWCEKCDPYSQAANLGKLSEIVTMGQVCRFVDSTCSGRRSDKKRLMRKLAESKGMPKRVGQLQAIQFLP